MFWCVVFHRLSFCFDDPELQLAVRDQIFVIGNLFVPEVFPDSVQHHPGTGKMLEAERDFFVGATEFVNRIPVSCYDESGKGSSFV